VPAEIHGSAEHSLNNTGLDGKVAIIGEGYFIQQNTQTDSEHDSVSTGPSRKLPTLPQPVI